MDKNGLPSWLEYDESKNKLFGIPSAEDRGRLHIEVHAILPPDATDFSQTKDVFTVNIQDDSVHEEQPGGTSSPVGEQKDSSNDVIKPIKCPRGSSVTMATIVVDSDMPAMKASEKVATLDRMCHHLNMPQNVLKFLPLGNKPAFDRFGFAVLFLCIDINIDLGVNSLLSGNFPTG